ncbi:MAG TPA: DUF3795 domain-containing protein [Candidatus Bathyarchaeia archaeon]|nr:DUF3795 domain-containing protein [Candidatus Bathyarchaeia archaeon]
MKKNQKYIAMCGLDCSACAAFIATQTDDDKLRKKTAEDWTKRYRTDNRNRPPVNPKDINCKGCLSNGPIYLYCHQCKIRKCGFAKNIKSCKQCQLYKCEKLLELQSHFF